MKYLVDANVLSEVTRPDPSRSVVRWMSQNEAELVMSPIVLGEIEYGIGLTESAAKRKMLQAWFQEAVVRMRILDIDGGTASAWASLLVKLRRKGLVMPVKDSLIAASALQHSLTVATRNTADFRNAGVKVINPFEA